MVSTNGNSRGTLGKLKVPHVTQLKDGESFEFAGLWDFWRAPDGEPIESAAIITTDANELVQDVHDRMPVILPMEHFAAWLDPANQDVSQLQAMLKPTQPQ